MKYFTTVCLSIVLVFTPTAPSKAFVVFDPTNFVTNLMDYIGFLADAVVQIESLAIEGEQLYTEIDSLLTEIEALESHYRNLQALGDGNWRMDSAGRDRLLDIYRDTRTLIELFQELDPQNPSYDVMLDRAVEEQYGISTFDPNADYYAGLSDGQKRIAGSQGAQFDAAMDKYKADTRRMAALEQLGTEREELIGRYEDQISTLGPESELQTLQLGIHQGNLNLRQNEAIMQYIKELVNQEVQEKADRAEAHRLAQELNDRAAKANSEIDYSVFDDLGDWK